MKRENINNILLDIVEELKQFTYIEQLLYLYIFIFLKVNLDTLQFQKQKYEQKYGNQSEKIQRLMNAQPIITKQDWICIYNKRQEIDFGSYINDFLHKLEEINPCLKEVFTEINFNKIPNIKLKNIIEKLNDICLAIKEEEDRKILEGAIEKITFLLEEENGTQGMMAGNSFTPKNVIKLMTNVSNIKENDNVADLVCGSGGLLIQAVKQIEKQKVQLYGQEKDLEISKVCKLNLLLHEVYDAEINKTDTIKDLFTDRKFDIVLGNPPFSLSNNLKRSIEEEKEIAYDIRYKYGIPPASKADYAFIQTMLYYLKSDGIMSTIVSLGALSRTGAEKNIRINMINDNVVDTIILLPPNLFLGTAIKTCIMICRKNKIQRDILFIDASKYYEKGKLQNYLSEENIKYIIEIYHQRKTIEGISYLASLKEVLENEGNLSVNKYVIEQQGEIVNIEQLRVEINDIEEQLKVIKDKKKFYAEKLYNKEI